MHYPIWKISKKISESPIVIYSKILVRKKNHSQIHPKIHFYVYIAVDQFRT